MCLIGTFKRKQTVPRLKISLKKKSLLARRSLQKAETSGAFGPHLESVQGHEQPQDVVGALEDPEDPQIPHHPLNSGILNTHTHTQA